MRVDDLVPGMKVEGATFVGLVGKHPLYPLLRLVVWRLPDGRWSHDALSPLQDVGEPETSTADSRQQALRAALLGEGALA